MSITQLAQVIGKVVKSPMGKLGMAAVAGVTMASIFSSCKKVEVNNTIELYDYQSDSLQSFQELILDSIVHP